MRINIRFAIRQMWRSPGFALAVVLMLALGVGVNTAVFSMLNGFLLRPLPYREPDHVGAIAVHKEGVSERTKTFVSGEENSFESKDWQAIRDNTTALTLAAYGATNGANMKASAAAGGVVRYVRATRISAGYFGVLGVPLLMGRELTDNEDNPGGANSVVLSHALWNASFGGDRGILGKSIELKGEPYTVVGVLAPQALTSQRADVFTPLRILSPDGECYGGDNCGIVARLRPGMNWTEAQTQLRRVRLAGFDRTAEAHGRAWLLARPLQQDIAGDMGDRVQALSLAVGFILLIACANLAGLMLVGVARRSREMATRLALGATRSALVTQLWTESAVLALSGGALGLLLAAIIDRVLTVFLPETMIPIGGIHIDARAMAFAIAASLLTSILFGILPALVALRSELNTSMASGGRTSSARAGRARQWMIAAQVALSFVLLTGAGLLVRTLLHLTTLPPGFDSNGVMTVKATLDSARYQKPGVFQQLMSASVANLREIKGVTGAAAGLSVPYERGLNSGFKILDGPQAPTGNRGSSLTYVTPGFFETFRIPVLAGRLPSETDTANAQPIAVVNLSFARRFYNDARPLGRHLRLSNTTFTIAGVVPDVIKQPGMISNAPLGTEPVLYIPAAQTPQALINIAHVWFQPSWIVRTTAPVPNLTASMERALAKADANLPISGAYSMADLQRQELQTQRTEVLLLGVLSGLALVLSAVGIYGTVANVVVQRTREIGIRLALGSTVWEAMLQVSRAGFVAAVAGLFAGVLLSLIAARLLANEVFGVSPYDPATLFGVALVLGFIALGASLLPTLRISRIQLAETLMTE